VGIFILPNFLIVAAVGALYVHLGGLSWMADRSRGVRRDSGTASRSGAAVHRRGHRGASSITVHCAAPSGGALTALNSPDSIGTTQTASGGILVKSFALFLKAGSLTFGYDEIVASGARCEPAGTEQLMQRQNAGVLTVGTSQDFAAKWLVYRLTCFAPAHPGLDLRVSATMHSVDFARDGVDVAVRHGDGN
jgi:hypothetical protein